MAHARKKVAQTKPGKINRPERRRPRSIVTPEDLLFYGSRVTSFRPHQDLVPDYVAILKWVNEKQNDSSFSSVINSLLPAIAYTLVNMVFLDKKSGRRYMRCNFGDILLREPFLKET